MTDDHERAALLRTILDNPADDTARGVMADYLSEQPLASDRARSDFIQVQLALAEFEACDGKRCNCDQYRPRSIPTPYCRGRWCRLLRMEPENV